MTPDSNKRSKAQKSTRRLLPTAEKNVQHVVMNQDRLNLSDLDFRLLT